MSRLPNVPITILLATARWLLCVDKLTVKTLRIVHKRTATDRIAAVCRFVKEEARQRARDAVAHGVIAERPSPSAARRPAPVRPTSEAPAHRARSPRQAVRAPQSGPAARNAGAPHRAMPPQHGPRDAVIAALKAQARQAHVDRLQQIATEQRQLHARVDGIERLITACATTPTPATVPAAPAVAPDGALISLVRRWRARVHVLLQRLWRAHP
jgi:hypothetical protein